LKQQKHPQKNACIESLISDILSTNDERAIASQVYRFHLNLTPITSGRRNIPHQFPLLFGLAQAVAHASENLAVLDWWKS